MLSEDQIKVNFSDVAGCEEAKKKSLKFGCLGQPFLVVKPWLDCQERVKHCSLKPLQ